MYEEIIKKNLEKESAPWRRFLAFKRETIKYEKIESETEFKCKNCLEIKCLSEKTEKRYNYCKLCNENEQLEFYIFSSLEHHIIADGSCDNFKNYINKDFKNFCCKQCNTVKDIIYLHPNDKNKDYLYYICTECFDNHVASVRFKNKELRKETNEEYQARIKVWNKKLKEQHETAVRRQEYIDNFRSSTDPLDIFSKLIGKEKCLEYGFGWTKLPEDKINIIEKEFYSLQNFITYIESKFDKNMSWKNFHSINLTNNKEKPMNNSWVVYNKDRMFEVKKHYKDNNDFKNCWKLDNLDVMNYNKYMKLKKQFHKEVAEKARLRCVARYAVQEKSVTKITMEEISKIICGCIRYNVEGEIFNLLGYTCKEIREYIESQFEDWMSWKNWTRYSPKTWDDSNKLTWVWNIDHIIAQCLLEFDRLDHPNFKKCWAMENLRPLNAKQNIINGAKLGNAIRFGKLIKPGNINVSM